MIYNVLDIHAIPDEMAALKVRKELKKKIITAAMGGDYVLVK